MANNLITFAVNVIWVPVIKSLNLSRKSAISASLTDYKCNPLYVTIKTAIAALKGEVVPSEIALPTSISYAPFEEGVEMFPKLPGSFFAGNNFESCNIGFTAEEIASQTGENN